jgi:NADP-dependent 3-hydroxy acid dehydrogenase YdfG
MIDVHDLSAVNLLKAAWPHLKTCRSGRVVNSCAEGMLWASTG